MSKLAVHVDGRTSHLCFNVAQYSHMMAKTCSEDTVQARHCIVGIVFCAFSVEAMLNHYGAILIDDWHKVEKRIRGTKDRHKLVFEKANIPSFLGTSEYQKIKECFDIRDRLAHGRSYTERIGVEVGESDTAEDLMNQVLSAPSGVEIDAKISRLEAYISAAKEIQTQIEKNGVYPSWSSQSGQALCEMPLDLQGMRVWSG